jgi:type VI secretion system protein ImpM
MPATFWRCTGMADAPGFYGKAVTRGDFLTRRLPAPFAAVWDGFLQTLIDSARARLGESWLDAFMTMPVWHFALGGGIAGAGQALGVLIPSVDRVGRYFPFTIVGFCASGGRVADDWLLDAERLALSALDDAFDPSALDEALTRLGPPGAFAGGALPPFGWSALAGRGAPPRQESLWWCQGNASIPASTLRTEALPNATESAWLVSGVS